MNNRSALKIQKNQNKKCISPILYYRLTFFVLKQVVFGTPIENDPLNHKSKSHEKTFTFCSSDGLDSLWKRQKDPTSPK
jgi:hypothetical protein